MVGVSADEVLGPLAAVVSQRVVPAVVVPVAAAPWLGADDCGARSGCLKSWTFESAANPGDDIGSFNYDGTVVGNAAHSNLGTVGKGALALPGDGSRIEIRLGGLRYEDLDNDGDGFTIATWVCSDSEPTSFTRQRYFSKLGADPFGFGVGQDGETQWFATTYGIADFPAGVGTLPPQNEWHHVAYVFSGSPISTIRFHVNGSLARTLSGNAGLNNSAARFYAIGGLGGESGEWFDGLLDDLRVYAVELTEAEIVGLVAMGTIGPKPEDAPLAVTAVKRVGPDTLRIEFSGEANTLHEVKSSSDLATSPFTGGVVPSADGLTTDGAGNGFVEIPIIVPGPLFFQIQRP